MVALLTAPMYAAAVQALIIVVSVTPTPTITTQPVCKIAQAHGAVVLSEIVLETVMVGQPSTAPMYVAAVQALIIVVCVIRTQVTTTQRVAKIVRARGAAVL